MRLGYTKSDGTRMEFELGDRPITIGRSPDADVVILDEKASRIHCGIRLWDGDFYIKDLKSRNGTYVNEERIDVAKLKPGDRIRIGSTALCFDQEPEMNTVEALGEIEKEMSGGKGYSTILREIVNTMEPGAKPPTTTAPPEESDDAGLQIKTESVPEPPEQPIRVTTRKKK